MEIVAKLQSRPVAPNAEHLAGEGAVQLTDCSVGERCEVLGITGGDPAIARRLCDIGFAPGAQVTVLRKAPLGDPVIYRVRDCDLALRGAQADTIAVRRALG